MRKRLKAKRNLRRRRVAFIFVIGILLTAGFAFGNERTSPDHINGLVCYSEGNNTNSQNSQISWREDENDRTLHVIAKQKEAKRVAAREAERLAEESQIELAKKAGKPQPNSSRAIDANPTSRRGTYKIDVSISEQKVRVYQGDTLIKEWVVSTGKNNRTPLGRFTTKQKGDWFFSEKYQQGGKWWIAFQGNYLFHSVPMDRNQNIIPEEAEMLGTPVSHGCVRLDVEHAKWLYDNIPQGTPVVIHN